MRKIWVFILGIVTGIILFLIFAVIYANVSQPNKDLILFDQPGECLISKSSLEVFQVLAPNVALTMIHNDIDSPVYLLINNEGKSYYDDQVIKVPQKKCFRQIGTYQYTSKEDMLKTVPVVQLMD